MRIAHLRKQQLAFADIPVIIVSTEGDDDDIIRGLEAGADAYLTKPFEFDELHELMTKVWARNSKH